jgi:hypothetical protein
VLILILSARPEPALTATVPDPTSGAQASHPEISDYGGVGNVLLATNVQPVLDIINNWILVARALVGSIGALAFVLAFIWKMTAVEPKTVLEAKQWIQRIVVGTIGVEMASTLVDVLKGSLPS